MPAKPKPKTQQPGLVPYYGLAPNSLKADGYGNLLPSYIIEIGDLRMDIISVVSRIYHRDGAEECEEAKRILRDICYDLLKPSRKPPRELSSQEQRWRATSK